MPAGVTVGAVQAMYFVIVFSRADLEELRRAPDRFEVMRPAPPAR